MFKLILIVFQSCKFKWNMSPRKASMEGGDEELGGVEEQTDLKLAAELKQHDISWNNKLRENMSPAKEVMMLLVQSMKGPRRQE